MFHFFSSNQLVLLVPIRNHLAITSILSYTLLYFVVFAGSHVGQLTDSSERNIMAASLVVALHKKSSSLENLSVPTVNQHARPQSISCDPAASRPTLLASDDYGGSNENGVSLVGYRQIHLPHSLNSNTRWHSDTNLASNPHHSESQLTVNKTELDINNDDDNIIIHWDIKANVSAKDWIGLYRTGWCLIFPGFLCCS